VETEASGNPVALAEAPELSSRREKESSTFAKKKYALIFLALLLISLPLRLVHLGDPLIGEHEFRQTQTALSVWDMREYGVSLLHPKLPLFGPPWEFPMEYPVFQLVAAGVDSVAPWHNLDASVRLTAVFFFYLCAIALYLLVRQLFDRPSVALFTAAVFLFSPYNLQWSRASTIEYAADFFALAYILCFLRWMFKPAWGLFTLAAVFGVLGCLAKITSFAFPLLVAGALMAVQVFVLARQHRLLPASLLSRLPSTNVFSGDLPVSRLILSACLLLIPLIVGLSYVHFSDYVKAQSPYTMWFCSNTPNMRQWDYGTLAQRLAWGNWVTVISRMRTTVLWDLSIPLLAGCIALPFRVRTFGTFRAANFFLGFAFAIAPLAVVSCFFNLYVIHTYYFISVAPCLALCAGAGLDLFYSLVRRPFIQVLLLLLLAGVWLGVLSPIAAEMLQPSSPDRRVIFLSQAGKIIPKDDPVIVVTPGEYNSFIPYHLKHRAFMTFFSGSLIDTKPLWQTDYLKQNGFHWLLVDGSTPRIREYAARIASRWKFARPIPVTFGAYNLYSLSDQ
jgi:hypothetical protein